MNIELLKNTFGDCKFTHRSTCEVPSSYIETSRELFFVWDTDNEEPVKLLTEKGDAQLSVVNSNKKNICLIKTDACLFDKSHQKCDCVLFDDNKMVFVEIKSVKTKRRNENRTIAAKQIATTIEFFRQNNALSQPLDLIAVICFKSGKSYPTMASSNSMRATFQEDYQTKLVEGNQITF